MPFQPGQSGNPAGRPPGARNKAKGDSHAAPDARARPGYHAVRAGQSQVHRFFPVSSRMQRSGRYDLWDSRFNNGATEEPMGSIQSVWSPPASTVPAD
jgi:hypothetical protein